MPITQIPVFLFYNSRQTHLRSSDRSGTNDYFECSQLFSAMDFHQWLTVDRPNIVKNNIRSNKNSICYYQLNLVNSYV